MTPGNEVKAAYPGVVEAIYWGNHKGNWRLASVPNPNNFPLSVVVLKHEPPGGGEPFYTDYQHMADNTSGQSYVAKDLSIGLPVDQGRVLGRQGNWRYTPANALITHLHFEVAVKVPGNPIPTRKTLDPIPYLGGQHQNCDGTRFQAGNVSVGPKVESSIDWKNRTYRVTCDDAVPKAFDVKLTNGNSTLSGTKVGSNDFKSLEINYETKVTGDLTGDGAKETVIVLSCSPQPTNYGKLEEVQIFGADGKFLAELPSPRTLNKNGFPLGPKYVKPELRVSKGDLYAGMMFYGPDDSHATGPSVHQTVVWHWTGKSFARVR
jgi:hypothetical protein